MGVFAVDRGIWDHKIFEGHAYGEREAWLWLVSSAAWKDCRVRSGGAMIDLKRGQLAFATRFLAKKWGWSHTSAVRFLILLKNETMIGTQATRHETIITICNYDKYAFVPASSETQSGTQDGTQTVRKRYKEEELNKDNKKEVSKIPLPSEAPRAVKRALPLPIGWQPSVRAFEIAEQHGQNVQVVESIFRDYLASSGKLYRDYDAAFHNFIRNQQTFNRGSSNGVRQSDKRGSIIDAADRAIAKLEREIAAEKQGCSATILSLPSQRLR